MEHLMLGGTKMVVIVLSILSLSVLFKIKMKSYITVIL